MTTCLCGHHFREHSHGPGRPVSCGRASCNCVRWREDKNAKEPTPPAPKATVLYWVWPRVLQRGKLTFSSYRGIAASVVESIKKAL